MISIYWNSKVSPGSVVFYSGDEWWGMLASLLRYRRAALRLFQCVDEWVDKVTRTVTAIRSKHLFGAASQTEVAELFRTSSLDAIIILA